MAKHRNTDDEDTQSIVNLKSLMRLSQANEQRTRVDRCPCGGSDRNCNCAGTGVVTNWS